MQLAFIVPTKFLYRYAVLGDCHLALAHLIDDNGTNEYANFYRREARQGKRVILDNGLFESKQVEPESLIHRAKSIEASVVCAPDALFNASGTIKEFKRFIRLKQEEGLVAEVMGIPQADNPADWWECFRYFELSRDCDLIGLSILSIPKAFEMASRGPERITSARMHVIRQLFVYQSLLSRTITPCHLLGMGESYNDMLLCKQLVMDDTIVSNDSTSAFVHGYHNVRYTGLGGIPGGKILEKLDFSINELTQDQADIIEHNINTALRIKKKPWTRLGVN